MMCAMLCDVVCGDDACLGTRGHGDDHLGPLGSGSSDWGSGMVTKKYVTLLDLT